jgi:hypothetical protein
MKHLANDCKFFIHRQIMFLWNHQHLQWTCVVRWNLYEILSQHQQQLSLFHQSMDCNISSCHIGPHISLAQIKGHNYLNFLQIKWTIVRCMVSEQWFTILPSWSVLMIVQKWSWKLDWLETSSISFLACMLTWHDSSVFLFSVGIFENKVIFLLWT